MSAAVRPAPHRRRRGRVAQAACRSCAAPRGRSRTLCDLVGDAALVLLGEASHGTHEFYALRAELTRRLIGRGGVGAIAVEADWPAAARVNRYVQRCGDDATPSRPSATSRLPAVDVAQPGHRRARGMAARARRWRGLLERRRVRPSLEGSVERLLHDAGIDCGVLDLRGAACSMTSARNG